MAEALKEAGSALSQDEVPIGAVIIFENKIIARGHNLTEKNSDPTAHAEMIAIKRAAEFLGGWRLHGCQLYVTIEPCPMCAGAIIQSRIDRLVYGARDLRAGAVGSVLNLFEYSTFNHHPQVTAGIREEECSHLMKEFFRSLRN